MFQVYNWIEIGTGLFVGFLWFSLAACILAVVAGLIDSVKK